MTIQQLRYVISISETGSFNKAAEQLYVSQPSLTSSIKELEREMANAGSQLGCVIFHRRGVDPINNPGGQLVLMTAETFKTILRRDS